MTLAIPLSSVKIRHEEKLDGRETRQQRGYYTSTGTQLDLGKEFVCGRARPIPSTMPPSAARHSRRETGPGLQAALSKSNTGAHYVFSGPYRTDRLQLSRLSEEFRHRTSGLAGERFRATCRPGGAVAQGYWRRSLATREDAQGKLARG